ncbi:MAG: GrxC family glutaredoxin [Gammaproteobacteria bacterium]|jgi:GrxC family glutaredoxin
MNKIEIYSLATCPYCHRAKALLDHCGLSYTEYDVSMNPEGWAEMVERSNRDTVPQIFIDGSSVGGSDELAELYQRGELVTISESDVSSGEVANHV